MMKILHTLALFLLTFVVFVSCQTQTKEPPAPVKDGTISLNNYLMSVDGRKSVRPFNLTCTKPWHIVLSDEQREWIEVEPSSGEGFYKAVKISVRLTENVESKLPRKAEILFAMDNDADTAVLKVSQGTEYFMRLDSLAMVAFYNAADGANWTKKWDLSAPIQTWGFYGQGGLDVEKHYWNGVFVAKDSEGSRRIDRLSSFEDIGMRGKLPQEMKNLTGMRMFELCGFELQGQTFDEFMDVMYKWDRLQVFWLTGGCKMGGALIPTKLANLRNLYGINFTGHDFVGFEEDFGSIDFPELVGLVIAKGGLEGELRPVYFDKMPKIVVLAFGENNLSGSVSPDLIGGKPYLRLMELNGNRFTGDFPFNLRNSQIWTMMDSPEDPASGYFCPQQPSYGFNPGTC